MFRRALMAGALLAGLFVIGLPVASGQEDVADISSQDLRAGGDANKRYLLIGPKEGAASPQEGYGLIVILPGGDGGPDFHPFVKRIYKYAIPRDFLAAEPVAVKWRPGQEVVWPCEKVRVEGMEFTTEEFIEVVVGDVKTRHRLNARKIFTLSWSSSGPAAYALSLRDKKSVTGSFVAMSVFRPAELPALDRAKGHAYFIYHSPDDQLCPFRMAQEARSNLAAHGALVELATYSGGHGWRGDVYGDIRKGMSWLQDAVEGKLPPLQGMPAAATSEAGLGGVLLKDGLETGRMAPDGWERGAKVPGVIYLWDKREAFEGKASLCLRKTATSFFPVAQWSRTVPREGTARRLHVSVQVKAKEASKAVVDVQFLDAQGKGIKHEWAAYIGAKNSGEPPAEHDWKEYTGTVEIPDGTAAIAIALQIYGPGTVWFDDITVRYAEGDKRGE